MPNATPELTDVLGWTLNERIGAPATAVSVPTVEPEASPLITTGAEYVIVIAPTLGSVVTVGRTLIPEKVRTQWFDPLVAAPPSVVLIVEAVGVTGLVAVTEHNPKLALMVTVTLDVANSQFEGALRTMAPPAPGSMSTAAFSEITGPLSVVNVPLPPGDAVSTEMLADAGTRPADAFAIAGANRLAASTAAIAAVRARPRTVKGLLNIVEFLLFPRASRIGPAAPRSA
ncbi:MAG TPA: hypothetical protein VNF73_09295 [Candidatus Saccharimonadales bacterium]|nr:hypothetical protein [Candidatus Saccharimonadales bacterium]